MIDSEKGITLKCNEWIFRHNCILATASHLSRQANNELSFTHLYYSLNYTLVETESPFIYCDGKYAEKKSFWGGEQGRGRH